MTDLKEMMAMRICVMIGSTMTYTLYKCTRKGKGKEEEEQQQRCRKGSDIKTDGRS